MSFLGKYSNGWGHVIVTICSLVFCCVLLLTTTDGNVQGLAITMATLLIGYWFGSDRARFEKKKPAPTAEQETEHE